MTEKAKPFKGTTPKGVFKYPNVITPDYGTKEYPKPDGEFNVRLILDADKAQALIKQLQPEFDKAVEKGREEFAKLPVANRKKLKDITINDFYAEVYDKDTEEPTGEFEFRFKSAASGKNKEGKRWERKLPVFDAKGVPAKNLKSVWGGTVGKVSFSASPYFVAATGAVGLSLRLEAVQIIELSAGGARSASEYGFDAEDGYDSTEASHGFTDETDGEGAGDAGDSDSGSDGNDDF